MWLIKYGSCPAAKGSETIHSSPCRWAIAVLLQWRITILCSKWNVTQIVSKHLNFTRHFWLGFFFSVRSFEWCPDVMFFNRFNKIWSVFELWQKWMNVWTFLEHFALTESRTMTGEVFGCEALQTDLHWCIMSKNEHWIQRKLCLLTLL